MKTAYKIRKIIGDYFLADLNPILLALTPIELALAPIELALAPIELALALKAPDDLSSVSFNSTTFFLAFCDILFPH